MRHLILPPLILLPPILLATILLATALRADPPRVLDAEAEKSGMGWRIEVTVEHKDTGWDDYANAWEVLDENGNQLALRELMHPHVNEQPFTRSLPLVMVPDGTRRVWIVAHASGDGAKSEAYALDLER